MKAGDFTEVALIDEKIIRLQTQLTALYERRKSIIHPGAPRQQSSGLSASDLASINLDIASRPKLSLSKTARSRQ